MHLRRVAQEINNLERRRLLAVQPVRIHRVDHGHRMADRQLAYQFQAVVEITVHLEQPGAVDQSLGQLPEPPAPGPPSPSSPSTRSTLSTARTASMASRSAIVPARADSRAVWVTMIKVASSPRPSWCTALMDTSRLAKLSATGASTPGRSATSRQT